MRTRTARPLASVLPDSFLVDYFLTRWNKVDIRRDTSSWVDSDSARNVDSKPDASAFDSPPTFDAASTAAFAATRNIDKKQRRQVLQSGVSLKTTISGR